MKRIPQLLILILCCLGLVNCGENTADKSKIKKEQSSKSSISTKYAKSFSIENHNDYTILKVSRPWPDAQKPLTYVVASEVNLKRLSQITKTADAVITTPLNGLVATSTTHIPALERLGALDKLVGFPDTKYVSSMPARERIAQLKIKELGSNQNINTELVLALSPDAVIGFGVEGQNNTYKTIQKANIPVLYNGDWTEETPLGKAEWIKFFGVLLGKEKEADSIFRQIETTYLKTKEIAAKANFKPTVLSGALYKDVWYLPAGKSWAAQFIKDANANYLYKDTEGTGSLSLSLESVLEKAQKADFWVAPSQFISYAEMKKANTHYKQFKPFKNKKVYTFAAARGATGGLLYYELAPQRPDIVLKDLVHIFHPDLLPNHNPFFFTLMQE